MIKTEIMRSQLALTLAYQQGLLIGLMKRHRLIADHPSESLSFSRPMEHLPRIKRRGQIEVLHMKQVPEHEADGSLMTKLRSARYSFGFAQD